MIDVFSQFRVVKKDGELVQQCRLVSTTIVRKWYKPWKSHILFEYGKWEDTPIPGVHTFRVGDRVKVRMDAGFHKGATGEINFIEPLGKCWVTRDNSGGPVYYDPDELELIWRRPNETV